MADKRFRLKNYVVTQQSNPEAIALIKELCPKLSRARNIYVIQSTAKISPKEIIEDLKELQAHLHVFPTFIHPNGYMFFGGMPLLRIIKRKGVKFMTPEQYQKLTRL